MKWGGAVITPLSYIFNRVLRTTLFLLADRLTALGEHGYYLTLRYMPANVWIIRMHDQWLLSGTSKVVYDCLWRHPLIRMPFIHLANGYFSVQVLVYSYVIVSKGFIDPVRYGMVAHLTPPDVAGGDRLVVRWAGRSLQRIRL